MKYLKSLSIGMVVGIVGLVLWRELPQANCCEESNKDYQAYDALVSRATTGDLNAVRTLYKASKEARREDATRMWALNGAIDGDDDLAAEYFAIYKTLSIDMRQADELVIRKNREKNGAQRVASMIGISLVP